MKSQTDILLATGDTEFSQKLAAQLNQNGSSVRNAGSMKEINRQLSYGNVSLIAVDAALLGVDGLEALRTASPTTTIFVLSEKPALPEVVDAVRKGADNYYLKNGSVGTIAHDINEAVKAENTPGETLKQVRKKAETDYIRTVLAHVGGNRGRAAKILGISERQLFNKIAEYSLR